MEAVNSPKELHLRCNNGYEKWEWENLTKVLPEVDFPFHEDNLKVKEMTEEPVRNQKTAYLKANIDHCY